MLQWKWKELMMAEITNELIYEVLKAIQGHITHLREDMEIVKGRLTSIDSKIGTLHTDLANQSSRIDRLELSIDRVNNRLNLSETPQ